MWSSASVRPPVLPLSTGSEAPASHSSTPAAPWFLPYRAERQGAGSRSRSGWAAWAVTMEALWEEFPGPQLPTGGALRASESSSVVGALAPAAAPGALFSSSTSRGRRDPGPVPLRKPDFFSGKNRAVLPPRSKDGAHSAPGRGLGGDHTEVEPLRSHCDAPKKHNGPRRPWRRVAGRGVGRTVGSSAFFRGGACPPSTPEPLGAGWEERPKHYA